MKNNLFYSLGYPKPRGVIFLIHKNRITQRSLNQNQKYFNPFVAAKAGSSFEEKNWWSKVSLDCPFKINSSEKIRRLMKPFVVVQARVDNLSSRNALMREDVALSGRRCRELEEENRQLQQLPCSWSGREGSRTWEARTEART